MVVFLLTLSRRVASAGRDQQVADVCCRTRKCAGSAAVVCQGNRARRGATACSADGFVSNSSTSPTGLKVATFRPSGSATSTGIAFGAFPTSDCPVRLSEGDASRPAGQRTVVRAAAGREQLVLCPAATNEPVESAVTRRRHLGKVRIPPQGE